MITVNDHAILRRHVGKSIVNQTMGRKNHLEITVPLKLIF